MNAGLCVRHGVPGGATAPHRSIEANKIVYMTTKKIKVQFRTPYDESVLEGTFEAFTRPSLTEPDNSMSIPEIIAKYTRGQGIPVPQHPWQVGVAAEDGYEVGDGLDTENFLKFGLPKQQQAPQDPKQDPQDPKQAPQDPKLELQEPQEPKE